jgi:hypothetical protein
LCFLLVLAPGGEGFIAQEAKLASSYPLDTRHGRIARARTVSCAN